MNVVSLLKQDHRTVEKLFSDYESSRDRAIADEICSELDTHTEIEERAVYPAIRDEMTNGKEMAEHAEEEHSKAKQIIGRIRRTEDADHLSELVGELQQAVQHHVDEEESDLFPKMEQELGGSRLEEIGQEAEALKT